MKVIFVMAKAKKEAEKTELTEAPAKGLAVPEYLQGYEAEGLEGAQQYVTPPRLKVLQKQTGGQVMENFNVGDVVILPQMEAIARLPYDGTKASERGEIFTFVPVFWFAEFCQWNPIELKGSEPAIIQRTLDPASDLARKCSNKDTWYEPHPTRPDLKVRNCEHMVFAMLIDGVSDVMPVVHAFRTAEWRTGSQLLTMSKMRRAPLYAQRFEASVSKRVNSKGDWYGLDIQNAREDLNPWVAADKIETYREVYLELKEAHAANLLQVNYDDDEGADVAPADTVSEF